MERIPIKEVEALVKNKTNSKEEQIMISVDMNEENSDDRKTQDQVNEAKNTDLNNQSSNQPALIDESKAELEYALTKDENRINKNVGKPIYHDKKESDDQFVMGISNKEIKQKINVSKAELDMELKIKFKKILWKMGHYGRIDVKIASYGEYENIGRRDGIGELTDIDVWGFSVQDNFQIKNIAIDCKNGENISPSSRLFWLKGIMEYIGNSSGYLVMGKKSIPSYLKETSGKLDITLMDWKNIESLNRIYATSDIDSLEVFSEDLFYKQERITEKAINELLSYRKYQYWIDEDHTKIHNIINLLKKYANKLTSNNKNHQIIVADFTILFTIALFNLCSYIMKTSLSDVKTGVLLFLYNGTYNLDKYLSVLDIVNKILKATAKNYDELLAILDYKPDFYESLVELCITILRRPHESRNLLRYMDAVLYSIVMPKKEDKKSLKTIFGNEYNEITVKLMFDIFDFIEKSTGLKEKLFPRQTIIEL